MGLITHMLSMSFQGGVLSYLFISLSFFAALFISLLQFISPDKDYSPLIISSYFVTLLLSLSLSMISIILTFDALTNIPVEQRLPAGCIGFGLSLLFLLVGSGLTMIQVIIGSVITTIKDNRITTVDEVF